jgi:hypothetical protein
MMEMTGGQEERYTAAVRLKPSRHQAGEHWKVKQANGARHLVWQSSSSNSTSGGTKDYSCQPNDLFDASASNEDVFEQVMQPWIDQKALQANENKGQLWNLLILAYGQSGKHKAQFAQCCCTLQPINWMNAALMLALQWFSIRAGSGKTHTMHGTPADSNTNREHGLNIQTIRHMMMKCDMPLHMAAVEASQFQPNICVCASLLPLPHILP